MTPIYALLRFVLFCVHPFLKMFASMAQRKNERTVSKIKDLAIATKTRINESLWTGDVKYTLMAQNFRDQSEMATLQTIADKSEESYAKWQGCDECMQNWRTYLSRFPGPIGSMMMAYADMALAIVLFAVCGGNDPISLGVDFSNLISVALEACDIGWTTEKIVGASVASGITFITGMFVSYVRKSKLVKVIKKENA